MLRVDIGDRTIRIPGLDLRGKRSGKTLLITGGMDGDEYAGMEAAFRLADEFLDRDFAGRLLILPVVNLPGFEAECSESPLDGKFPKGIFPGRSNGSSTERLVAWLNEQYVSQADFWYDAHGGALTERLNPFLWTYQTGVREVDERMERLHVRMGAETIVYEKATRGSKANLLARRRCGYLMAESGDRGLVSEADVARHVRWLNLVMAELGMVEGSTESTVDQSYRLPSTVYRLKVLHHLSFVCAPFDGFWQAADFSKGTLRRGALVGRCTRLDQGAWHAPLRDRELKASKEGTILWWKETARVKRGELVCAFAF